MTLKEFRKSHGMTLNTLAEHLGCCPSAISKYERNVETVPNHIIDKIYEKFGVKIDKEYNHLSIYKQRIKDLEAANLALVNHGIATEKNIADAKQEINNLVQVVTEQINKITRLLKGE